MHYAAVCEVSERLAADGSVIAGLDEAALRAHALGLVESGLVTAAVSLLHSDIQPAHELAVEKILRECGFQHVSLSSRLAPFIRILPRAQSAVANAYLTGPVEQFIRDVATPIAEGHDTVPLSLMTSAAAWSPPPPFSQRTCC